MKIPRSKTKEYRRLKALAWRASHGSRTLAKIIRDCRWCGSSFHPRSFKSLCCSKKCSLNWAKENRKPSSAEDNFRRKLVNDHQMTVEGYEAMLSSQNYLCKLCSLPLTGKICIDHSHECCPQGKSCFKCRRGLIHNACNLILGHAKDDPALLKLSAQYLERYL